MNTQKVSKAPALGRKVRPRRTIGPVIRPAKGHNRFCGPSALSIITGIDTAEAARLLREVSGRRSIKGTYDGWMTRALRRLGYVAQLQGVAPTEDGKSPTLARWLRQTTKTRGTDVYLITAGNHWVVVQGRRAACGQTKEVVSIGKAKKRRGLVKAVFKVFPSPYPARVDPRAGYLPAVKPRPKALGVRGQAQRLAAAIGFEIDRDDADGFGAWIIPPEGTYADEADDPCNGDHFCSSWEEVLDKLQDYAADLRKRAA